MSPVVGSFNPVVRPQGGTEQSSGPTRGCPRGSRSVPDGPAATFPPSRAAVSQCYSGDWSCLGDCPERTAASDAGFDLDVWLICQVSRNPHCTHPLLDGNTSPHNTPHHTHSGSRSRSSSTPAFAKEADPPRYRIWPFSLAWDLLYFHLAHPTGSRGPSRLLGNVFVLIDSLQFSLCLCRSQIPTRIRDESREGRVARTVTSLGSLPSRPTGNNHHKTSSRRQTLSNE